MENLAPVDGPSDVGVASHALRHLLGGPDPLYTQFGHGLPGIEVYSRYSAVNINNIGNGSLRGTAVTPEKDTAVSNLSFVSGGTAQAGATLIRFGLWRVVSDTEAILVAETANDTSIFGVSSTMFTRVLDTARGGPARVVMERGVRYLITNLVVGATTVPNCRSITTVNNLAELSPKMGWFRGSVTDHPAVGSGFIDWGVTGFMFWGYAS
jgi:hypothetical protein